MADAVRVALLARAGKAREQLHKALEEAGADIVAEGDPADLEPAQVAGLSPTVFLVSLEPAIEAALDRFDDLLSAPGVEVMFDDAEVTGKLDGWDLNRWARHMVAKLLGSEGLPPVPGGALSLPDGDLMMVPGAPPTPAELMDHARLEDYTFDASDLATSVPVSQSLTPDALDTLDADDGLELSWNAGTSDASDLQFSLDNDLGIDLDLSGLELGTAGMPSDDGDAASGTLGASASASTRFSSFGSDAVESLGDLDADVAQLAAQLEAFEKNDNRFASAESAVATVTRAPAREAIAPTASDARVAPPSAPAQSNAPPAKAVSFDFSNLALAPMEGEVSSTPIAPEFREAVVIAPGSLQSAPAKSGAVVILAGLGGPDAVRQLLSSLPEQLSVPVLLYQHLEVGKHERLVEQLAKISRLPVLLATDGTVPEPGKVSLLPAGMTATSDGASLRFSAGSLSQLISALPPADSMIIVLSGAEPQLVAQILTVKDQGGLVLAQDPEVCFDATAAEAMRTEGAAVFPALGLARQIASRWPN